MIVELQNVLNNEIPLTRSIGICVEECANNRIRISAPLENNINHKNTAFGGSLYSVSVLAGWSLMYTLLKTNNRQGHIVIQESNIQYLKPVTERITATCYLDENTNLNRFFKIFDRKGIARIKLSSTVQQDDQNAVFFEGLYVIHK